MNSTHIEPGLAIQVSKVYGNEPPPRHIILCASPLSAFLTREAFHGLVQDTSERQEQGVSSPIVRCLIQAAWQTGSEDFRRVVGDRVKAYTEHHLSRSRFDVPNSVIPEVAIRVWETTQGMLHEPTLFGLDICVGQRVLAGGTLFPEEPTHDVKLWPHQLIARNIADLARAFNGSENNVFTGSGGGFVIRKYLKQGKEYVRKEAVPAAESTRAQEEISVLGGCYLPHKFFCWVGDGPQKIVLDFKSSEHAPPGEVLLKYRDGWESKGVTENRVGSSLLTSPRYDEIMQILTTPDRREQRKLIANYGEERFLNGLGASVTHSDDFGKLWKTGNPIRIISSRYWPPGRHAWPGPYDHEYEGFAFVRVVNATPRSDGSFEDYFLRVPYEVQTAHEAVAWTFARDREEYQPHFQT